ncbi:RNA polymerase sigma factor [Streptomyces sp. NPDC050263]|uniref:RNA polymerase sigma factor n=1 Tax=Streptomyces sp. NPDC050263 TaxID=3155037 RepID=UPI0034405D4C
MAEQPNGSVVTLAAVEVDQGAEMIGPARRLPAEEGVPESVLGAEDVVQSAFTKALRAPANIREPRAYLYAVIRNDVRAASRQNRTRREWAAACGGQEQVVGDVHVADFSELVANRMVVHKALYGLPPQQRTAVWVTKAMDCTQAETAEFMEKRPGTIATHVVRAVAALRANLAALLVAVATVFVLVGSRVLEVVPAAGSEESQDPHEFSAGAGIYVVGALLLVAACVVPGFRAWRRRRSEFDEAGTFARRSR